MRLKDEFITYETDGEQIMVAAGTDSFSGLVRSNETAGFIVECLKKTVTEDDIVHAMTDAYDAPEAVSGKVIIDRQYIESKLKDIVQDEDLSRFIL